MKTQNSVLVASLATPFFETASALPAAAKAKTAYTTVPVTTTYVDHCPGDDQHFDQIKGNRCNGYFGLLQKTQRTPQSCWLYNKPFTNYPPECDQSCFATVKGVTTPSYPKSKVFDILGGVSTQNGRTKAGDTFAGSVDTCAKYYLSLSNCQLYMYNEIEFQDGYNCHAYSSDWMAGSSLAGAGGYEV
ncbi:uncharacterized protein DFL_002117 [Arthrobotrys flagrans]|uniref:Uncharacterized protein n=1 Tax=Arthrobotrys flagrans TaxID=97331 RepID=A0A437A9L2_ARTFL|nr:hypothetical protein DFL_002117 [Arthrobotrys flagrans]